MAFDAGFMLGVVAEINKTAAGGRVEKVLQPEKDEIVLVIHRAAQKVPLRSSEEELNGSEAVIHRAAQKTAPGSSDEEINSGEAVVRRERENYRLALNAGASSPKMYLTSQVKENPAQPPMFCMLMRKHLTGAKLIGASTVGYDRVAKLVFEGYDDLGFRAEKIIYIEIMGKHSNMMLCNEQEKIISPLHAVDFTSSSKRQVLPGMMYELPPSQQRLNPLEMTHEGFVQLIDAAPAEMTAEKFLMGSFDGFSSLLAREIVARTARGKAALLRDCDADKLWFCFNTMFDDLRAGRFEPSLIRGTADGLPVDYAFFRPRQYDSLASIASYESFGALTDDFFTERDRAERMRQKSADVLKLLSNISAKLTKKINLQVSDLAACEEKEVLRRYGELITSNIYRLKKGDTSAVVEDYFDESCPEIAIPMDEKLTPSQNAQRYFKKYAKLRSAEEHLIIQMELAKQELAYVDTVFDSLTRVDTEKELAEVREELSVYSGRVKPKLPVKGQPSKPMEFRTSGGFRVLCGKNNKQNEMITYRIGDRNDWWFHIKNLPGSHTVMICEGTEPSEEDFTQAAKIAAYYSKAKPTAAVVAVDYTKIRYLKKPPNAKPGFVTYEKYYTAYVAAQIGEVEGLRI